jgi:hypothetical protein
MVAAAMEVFREQPVLMAGGKPTIRGMRVTVGMILPLPARQWHFESHPATRFQPF